MKTVRVTGAFKKDLKRVVRRGYDQGLIELIIDQLRSESSTPGLGAPASAQGSVEGVLGLPHRTRLGSDLSNYRS